MVWRAVCGTVLILGLTAPVAGQAREILTETTCRAIFDKFVDMGTGGDPDRAPTLGRLTARNGGCLAENLLFPGPEPYGPDVQIDRLTWGGDALAAFATTGALPTVLTIDGTGVRIQPSIGEPLQDYVFRVQSARGAFDVGVSVRRDQAAKRLTLDRFAVDFNDDNSVHLTGKAERVDLSTPERIQFSLGTLVLTELHMDIESNGLFETHLFPALASGMLQRSDDPARQVEKWRQVALDGIGTFPEATFPGQTRDSLERLVADMPHPAGMLRLDIRAPDGFGASRFAGFALRGAPRRLEDIWPVLEGVTIEAVYEQTVAGED